MMTPEEKDEKIIELNGLEKLLIHEISKLDNEKLMNIFLDWQECRHTLNKDFKEHLDNALSE